MSVPLIPQEKVVSLLLETLALLITHLPFPCKAVVPEQASGSQELQ